MDKQKKKVVLILIFATSGLLVIFLLLKFIPLGDRFGLLQSTKETKIYGTSTFITQGELDQSTGEAPSSATLLIGDRYIVGEVLKLEDDGGTYYATEDNLTSNTRAIKTQSGKYEVILNDGEEAFCLVEPEVHVSGSNRTTKYAIRSKSLCKIVKQKTKTRVDITSIGFGNDNLKCTPARNCQDILLQFK
jgi:hypothetical protein